MVNTITSQTLNDGQRNFVVQIFVTGDGSGEETATKIVDVASTVNLKLVEYKAELSGFAASLLWDATTDVPFLNINDGYSKQDFRSVGGLVNNSGSGKTGDIMMTTVGLGAADKGSITLWMVKK